MDQEKVEDVPVNETTGPTTNLPESVPAAEVARENRNQFWGGQYAPHDVEEG